MLRTYLAIIDSRGLRCIYEESESTTELLTREVSTGREISAKLVWIVARCESYRSALSALSAGLRRDAWKQLEYSADQLGTVTIDRVM